MPDGNWPNGVLSGIVPKLSWRKNEAKQEREMWERRLEKDFFLTWLAN